MTIYHGILEPRTFPSLEMHQVQVFEDGQPQVEAEVLYTWALAGLRVSLCQNLPLLCTPIFPTEQSLPGSATLAAHTSRPLQKHHLLRARVPNRPCFRTPDKARLQTLQL